jgi:pantetheine-phosphate adenylyltransferase
MRTVFYPGSFDPVTNGHLDVIQRASRLFDKVTVAIAVNQEKEAFFTMSERKELLETVCRSYDNIDIVCFNGLLVEAVKEFKAAAVIRGLRAVADFEYEFQMALMNRELNEDCETIFMMPSPAYSFVSSRLIKEIASCGGDISAFVPTEVIDALKGKIGNVVK